MDPERAVVQIRRRPNEPIQQDEEERHLEEREAEGEADEPRLLCEPIGSDYEPEEDGDEGRENELQGQEYGSERGHVGPSARRRREAIRSRDRVRPIYTLCGLVVRGP